MTGEDERLPRRDWLLIPLLSLLSLGLVGGISEVAARVFWPQHLEDACAVHDPVLGVRFRPDCRSRVKSAESPWLENSYNACGFRTAEPCGPKPAGGVRVAVIGSSISSGYLVPYGQTFAARAAEMLRRRCRVPVDFQNLAVPGVGLEKAPLHLDAALALRPDAVLMALSPHDLEVLPDDAPLAAAGAPAPAPQGGGIGGFAREAVQRMRASRAALVAQHFLYENLDSYLPLYLQHGDEADYLRPPLSQGWQRRLRQFDAEVGEIAARTRAAGAPFNLVFVPNRAQAALVRWKRRPPGIDPALLGKAVGEIARRHDVPFLDLTETIGDRPDAAGLFYPVDSHPDGAASAIIADKVTDLLLDRDAALAACRDRTEASR